MNNGDSSGSGSNRKRQMKSTSLFLLAIVICIGCSRYEPETYDAADYLANTKYKSARDFYVNFSGNGCFYHPNDKTVEYWERKPKITIYAKGESHSFSFKKPVAVIFKREKLLLVGEQQREDDEDYSFIKLPNIEMANKLSEAKTLIKVRYGSNINRWTYDIKVFDVEENLYIGEGGSGGEKSYPGIKGVIDMVNHDLANQQFVSDNSDIVSIWKYNFDKIRKLTYSEPNTNLYRTIHKRVSTGKSFDITQLPKYEKSDVKAIVDIGFERNDFTIKLLTNEYLDEDFLIRVNNHYNKEFVGNYITKPAGATVTGHETINAAFRHFYNHFVISSNGDIITEDSTTITDDPYN